MASDSKPKIIVIVGTTASGKSKLAVELAKKYKGEVVSADSRQVYRKLDIGTAKITKEEMEEIPHHLIDIVDLDTTYTVADFKKDASEAIADIVKRGNTPIIAGGTFFYIDALMERISTPEVPPNDELRSELESKEASALYEALLKLDPRRAQDIDPYNKRRLVRALEIVHALGAVPESSARENPYQALTLGINTPKEELLKKLEVRAKQWLHGGFVTEVQSLLESGVQKEHLSEMGFEYQLGMQLLDGTLSETAFIETFMQKNWQYAKRQLTWLKRDKSVHWIYLSEKREMDMLVEQFLIN